MAGARADIGRSLLTLASGLAALALLAVAVLGEGGILRNQRTAAQLRRLETRLAEVRAGNARLAAEVDALKSSPEYVEWVIRQDLGWIRPGERILRVRRR